MAASIRTPMNVLHTWAGVVLGGVMFAVFWMGTLSVFDREIDRWMMPMTRLAPIHSAPSIDVFERAASQLALEHRASQWTVLLPNERMPVAQIIYRDGNGVFRPRFSNAQTGHLLESAGTLGGSGFFFPFHYNLHIKFWDLGYWIVGIAAMGFLALLVSGVIIHHRIFANFFVLRFSRKTQRTALDLHNVSGVLGLPFHFVITLSGLIIFASIYWPSAFVAYEGGKQAPFFRESFGVYSRAAAGVPGSPPVSVDSLTREAVRLWGQGRVYFVRIWYPGDAASYIEMRRSFEDDVTMNADVAYFDAATGSVLHYHSASRIITAQRFIAGMHFIQFRHWTLRWGYFVLGLLGCVLIATGFLFWLESRRKKHQQLGWTGVRVVEGLTVGSTAGIVIATLAFFVANRLLPLGTAWFGVERAALEASVFYLVWIGTFGHAWSRPQPAWIEQCWGIATLAVAAPLLNWITTGDHLARSLVHPHLWPVGGMDLMLLIGALAAALAAWKLQRRATGASVRPVSEYTIELRRAE